MDCLHSESWMSIIICTGNYSSSFVEETWVLLLALFFQVGMVNRPTLCEKWKGSDLKTTILCMGRGISHNQCWLLLLSTCRPTLICRMAGCRSFRQHRWASRKDSSKTILVLLWLVLLLLRMFRCVEVLAQEQWNSYGFYFLQSATTVNTAHTCAGPSPYSGMQSLTKRKAQSKTKHASQSKTACGVLIRLAECVVRFVSLVKCFFFLV